MAFRAAEGEASGMWGQKGKQIVRSVMKKVNFDALEEAG
jgi:hypothetical protein